MRPCSAVGTLHRLRTRARKSARAVFIPADASEKTAQFQPGTFMLEILYIKPAIQNDGPTEARITRAWLKHERHSNVEPLPPQPDDDMNGAQSLDREIVLPTKTAFQPFNVALSNLDMKPVHEGSDCFMHLRARRIPRHLRTTARDALLLPVSCAGWLQPPSGWLVADGPPAYTTST
jgi:hypothetical protein